MKKKASYKIKDFKEHDENPFVRDLIVPKKRKTNVVATKNGGLINYNTGEIEEDTLFLAQRKELDKEPFIKLFQTQLKALFGLSTTAIRVFGYLMEEMKFDDKVYIRWKKAKEFTGYKADTSIQRGLAELLDNAFIARTDDNNLYYINPQIFFKGDRIVLVTEYRKKKTPKKIIDPNQTRLNFGGEQAEYPEFGALPDNPKKWYKDKE